MKKPYAITSIKTDKDIGQIDNLFTILFLKTEQTFYDRGDPTVYDFTSLTTDGVYHDLDLSGLLPDGTKAVLLRVNISDDAVNSYVQFRKKGNTNAIVASTIRTQVIGISTNLDIILGIGTDKKLEYIATNTTFTSINIAVKGWWI